MLVDVAQLELPLSPKEFPKSPVPLLVALIPKSPSPLDVVEPGCPTPKLVGLLHEH